MIYMISSRLNLSVKRVLVLLKVQGLSSIDFLMYMLQSFQFDFVEKKVVQLLF